MGLREELGQTEAGWYISVYPDAREAAGSFRATIDSWDGRRGTPGEGKDPERSRLVASSRARTKLRRYCAANRLNRFGTLTYAGHGCHDPLQLRADLAEFFRNVRTGLGGRPIPYVWVPEWHKTDHGLHGHFAFARYVRRTLIEQSWARGFVKIKLLGDLPVGSTGLDEARRAGGYMAKYIGKDFDHEHLSGLHRYEVAENFQPRREVVGGPTLGQAVERACEIMGAPPVTFSTSDQWQDWAGPSAVALSWAS
jgi:hypothetical protein